MKRIFFLLLIITNIYALDAFINDKSLKNLLNDKHLVIIDVSKEYDKSHIIGSVSFDVDSIDPYKEGLEITFSDLGITNDSNVIIYGRNTDDDIKNSAFLAFVLISKGFENVSILDGGYMSWVFEYDILTTPKPTNINTGSITLKDRDLIADVNDIKNNKNIKLIDARDPQTYYGVTEEKDKRYIGHIGGAKNSYYAYKFLKDNTLRPQSDLKKIYVDGLGLDTKDNIVVYADTPKEAAVEWYIVYKKMGYKNAKLYYNSFKEYVDLGLNTVRFKWE